jgi:hypothetical protein
MQYTKRAERICKKMTRLLLLFAAFCAISSALQLPSTTRTIQAKAVSAIYTASRPQAMTLSSFSSSSSSAVAPSSSVSRSHNQAFIKGLRNLFRWPVFSVFKKSINLWGVLFGLQCWSIMVLWMLGMLLFMPFKLLLGGRLDPDGILIDTLGRWWSFLVSFPHSLPRITGRENLPPRGEACVYIANHASWMDIPILGLLPPLKFVCKKELTKV